MTQAKVPGTGVVDIQSYDDAETLLKHPDCTKLERTQFLAAVVKSMDLDGKALLRFARNNSLTLNGKAHQARRRYAMRLLGEIAALWPPDRLIQCYREMLIQAATRDCIDLNTDLSEPLVCRVIGARFSAPDKDTLNVIRTTEPLMASSQGSRLLRLSEFRDLVALAQTAEQQVAALIPDPPECPGLDKTDWATAAVVATFPASAMLIEALNRAQMRILQDPALAARLAAEDAAILPFVHSCLLHDSIVTKTTDMRANSDIALPGGTVLKKGTVFSISPKTVNRDLIPASGPTPRSTGLTFSTGAHRCAGAGLTFMVLCQAIRTLVSGFELRSAGAPRVQDTPAGTRHLSIPVRVKLIPAGQ